MSNVNDEKVNNEIEDTLSITMELQRPLLKNEEVNIDDKPKKSGVLKKIVVGVIALSAVGLAIWKSTCYEAGELSVQAAISNELVEVSGEDVIAFMPKHVEPTKGFIFYQGAKVDAKAYSIMAREIAEEGYFVALIDSPLDFAMLSMNKASSVIKDYPSIKSWSVGGHSLGGVVASKYAGENINIDGLVLLASYPINDDIKSLGVDTVSVWGSVDGVLNHKQLARTKDYLPKDTTFVQIEGANHAQFGDYGKQSGDRDALISSEEQMDITIESIIELLENI